MTTSHVAATVPLPPPVARPQDAQLRQDVRWLAATLGRVVGRLAGEDTFRAVEELRRACRARRLGVPGAPDLDALLARTRALPPETARLTARAFTVFFILINAAEQAHRVRRARQDDQAAAQRGSVRWSLRRLREAGHGAEAVRGALRTLDVRPVLTAHPTESARRTILDLQARLAEGLLARDAAPAAQRRAIEGRLAGAVEQLAPGGAAPLRQRAGRAGRAPARVGAARGAHAGAARCARPRSRRPAGRVGAESPPQRGRAAPHESQLHAGPGGGRSPGIRVV